MVQLEVEVEDEETHLLFSFIITPLHLPSSPSTLEIPIPFLSQHIKVSSFNGSTNQIPHFFPYPFTTSSKILFANGHRSNPKMVRHHAAHTNLHVLHVADQIPAGKPTGVSENGDTNGPGKSRRGPTLRDPVRPEL